MKVRKSDAFLIISSSYLGADDDILSVYKQAAKYYNAQVIHLGPTASQKEINDFKKVKKLAEAINSRIHFLEGAALKKAEDSLDEKENDLELMTLSEAERVKKLVKVFGKVKFVTTPDLCLSRDFSKDYSKNAEHIQDGIELSKYLFLSPIPPSGERTTRSPITSISIDFLKTLGRSWIVPHPVPIIECFPRPGLNEAHSYYTVGCLRHAAKPTMTRDQYKIGHMPCAILVLVDRANGEYHAKQLHIDYLNDKRADEKDIVVIDDGIVFSENGWKEVKSCDKASMSTDDHVPFTHPGQLGCLRAVNMKHKPETFINGGDAADFDTISHHNEERFGERENKRIATDLYNLRLLLDAQTSCPSIKNKIIIDSNHHEWITDFVMKNPALIGLLDWRTLAKERFSDWKVIIRSEGEQEIYSFGDFTIRHGDKEGGVKKGERVSPNGKYICGHWHRYGAYKRSVMLGCGAMLGPRYIGGQINAWQSQFATLTKYKEIAAVSPKIVLHDNEKKVSRVAYRGEIIEVEWYAIFGKNPN